MDAGWTVPRETVTEGGRDGHGRWTGWSRKVVKNERSTVENHTSIRIKIECYQLILLVKTHEGISK